MILNVDAIPSLAATDAVVKATMVLASAALASVALRRASAATRHFVWALALVSALVLPGLSLALPRWQLPLVRVSGERVQAARTTPPVLQASDTSVAAMAPTAMSSAPVPSTPMSGPPARRTVSANELLLSIWALGALLVAGRAALGVLAVGWISRRTECVTSAHWLPVARELAGQVGVPRVAFLRSDRASMPMAWGVLRPSIMMPAAADRWPVDRLRIVLLHELAHVKRRDCLIHLIAQLACAFYWFNPLAWVAARRIRAERERACDDLVLAAGTPGPDYAQELLEIARVMRGGRFPALTAGASLAMAHRSQLEGRLMAILDPSVPRSGLSRFGTTIATVVFTVALLPLASIQPWAYAASGSSRSDISTPSQAATAGPSKRAVARHVESRQPRIETSVDTTTRVAIDTAIDSSIGEITGSVIDGVVQGVMAGFGQATPSPNPKPEPSSGRVARGQAADPKIVAALTAALKDSDKEVREQALQGLVKLRDPSVFEPLIQALGDTDADLREQAAFGLGQMRDRRAVQPLTGALKDSAPAVREQAVFALGQLRDPSSADAIAGALRDANGDVREQAAFALGQIRDARSVEPLISALKDADADAREQAAFALGQIRDRAAVEALIIALKDADADVREQAAFALGQLRDARAIDGLTAALKDPNADVRQQAAFALGQLAR